MTDSLTVTAITGAIGGAAGGLLAKYLGLPRGQAGLTTMAGLILGAVIGALAF